MSDFYINCPSRQCQTSTITVHTDNLVKSLPSCSPLFSRVKEFLVCLSLEIQVLERFEQENDGKLITATLCLLEVSQRGLLETELIAILADCDNMKPLKKGPEKGEGCRIYLRDLMFILIIEMVCSVFG